MRSLGVLLAAFVLLLPALRGPAQEPTRGEPIPMPYSVATEPDSTIDHNSACPECAQGECWENGHGEWAGDTLLRFHDFTSRNSQTHGRSVGLGKPLRGTSWLNRPYETSVEFGGFFMTGKPATAVRAANDKFAAVSMGWDWDHYWGSQARLGWSTPDLNTTGSSSVSDNLFLLDVSLMYYPWGDSRIRPYWRMGMGMTDIEFANVNGVPQQEFLFTVPFGVGVKHQFRRWVVGRIEVVDNLAFGLNEAKTMNNFTLTAGVEARFGGRPSGYWAWRPRGYAW